MPRLLQRSADRQPDAAFARFDEFMSGLPAGCSCSRSSGEPAAARPGRRPDGHRPSPGRPSPAAMPACSRRCWRRTSSSAPPRRALAAELDRVLGQPHDLQDVLDSARRWAQATGSSRSGASRRCSASMRPAGPLSRDRRGRDPGAAATGRRLARGPARPDRGRRLGRGRARQARLPRDSPIGSDLDLIFIYDAAGSAEGRAAITCSDGPKPLAPIHTTPGSASG